MIRKNGIHFYINIVNLNDVVEAEEAHTGEVKHAIHALDTFFSSIEAYGKRHYPEVFVIEKITGSRLHMYIESERIPSAFEIVSAVSQYAYRLTTHLSEKIGKYKTLIPFQLQVGVCFGGFYEFEFKREYADELTTIGYAANFAAKLQGLAQPMHICVSENVYESMSTDQQMAFKKMETTAIQKYDQNCYFEAFLNRLKVKYSFQKDLEFASQIAANVNLSDMQFRDATQQISYRNLSKKEGKKLKGIPLFADVRGFTVQFDAEDSNLEEMAVKTQSILTTMYDIVENCHGTHVQFQGDREMAVFHDYPSYSCAVDAVIAGLRIIDGVKNYQVSIGVGQAYGKLFAAKIGARGEKDSILLGRTVAEADKNEDEHASKNQLVISTDVYKKLQTEKPDLASLFRLQNGYYYTTIGYQAFLSEQSKRQLMKDNRKNNYNGAWGESGAVNDILNNTDYYHEVRKDIRELQRIYPFTTFTCPPTVQIQPIIIYVIAADSALLQKTCAMRQDFLQEYSKELEILVPFDYRTEGCKVYGGAWIDLDKIPPEYQHFHERLSDGRFSLCVGIPESFEKMRNVVLECVRTADRMLTAYELFQSGQTETLELISYAHGQKGIEEYRGKKKKYQSK